MNLWPFRKRKPAEKTWKAQLVEHLAAWRPVGSTFEYLGRQCVVTSHWHLEGWGEFGPRCVVGIQADYTDDLGVLRNIQFSAAESHALMQRVAILEQVAGQGPDWNMAQHWIDRYATGVDDELALDRVADALSLPDPTTAPKEAAP